MADWYRRVEDGVALDVRLMPRGARDAVDGVRHLDDGAAVLTVRVRAVPEKGAANAALETVIAAFLGVAPARVTVAAGRKGRRKTVHVAGEANALSARLAGRTDAIEGEGR